MKTIFDKQFLYSTFKKWLNKTWPEQKDCLIISENDEKMLKSAFNAGRKFKKIK